MQSTADIPLPLLLLLLLICLRIAQHEMPCQTAWTFYQLMWLALLCQACECC